MSKNDDDVDDERKSPNTLTYALTHSKIMKKKIILKNISYYVRERDEAIKSGGDDERQQFLQQ